MTWVAVLGTLLGTLLGVAGTIASQQLALRAAERRERLERQAALRLERKQAIDAFFDAAQLAERVAADREAADHATMALTSQTLWAAHKRLALISSERLSQAVDELADTLGKCIWNGTGSDTPVWKHISDQTWNFRRVAREDLAWIEPVD